MVCSCRAWRNRDIKRKMCHENRFRDTPQRQYPHARTSHGTIHAPSLPGKQRHQPHHDPPNNTHPTPPLPALPAALLCACLAMGLLAAPADAHAARKKKTVPTAAKLPAKGSVRVKYFDSSSESTKLPTGACTASAKAARCRCLPWVHPPLDCQHQTAAA